MRYRPGTARSYTATRRGRIGVLTHLPPEQHEELHRIAHERSLPICKIVAEAVEALIAASRSVDVSRDRAA